MKKQGFWALIGFGFMVTAIKIDYHVIKRFTGIIMIITTVLLVVVLACPAINGAKRWIPLGFAALNPLKLQNML